ncbi:hypothetical protein F7734_52035 [Scytonema sp. UIC 10036]|uniref:hypothetical protein n=1 Tax=Scytonema sp. UIC 10036 TaxID=2304196 RepID=UPI0012DA7AFA|nr:hypothetical protein [Scytonema sp. UIC 10036]MUH00354.1 hypothetical protein [Scytonema sp. UIC 10036]
MMDINIKQLPFSVWWQISEINGTWANVAFKKWAETVDENILQAMKLDDWEAVADTLGYSFEWACKQYKQYRASSTNQEEVRI